jgi:anaerobic ribonucleoside-triphosphate reductase activating protein
VTLKLADNINVSFIDYPNKNQWCVTLYTVGCPHNCTDCHNYLLHDVGNTKTIIKTVDSWLNEFDLISKRAKTKNFTILGGEPLAPWNIDGIKELLLKNTQYNFCIYTGYDIEYVKANNIIGFEYIKTGKYIKELYNRVSDANLFTLGSTNQQLWDKDFNLLSVDGIYKQ